LGVSVIFPDGEQTEKFIEFTVQEALEGRLKRYFSECEHNPGREASYCRECWKYKRRVIQVADPATGQVIMF